MPPSVIVIDGGTIGCATGHYRNGILLAPATAARVSSAIVDGGIPDLIKPFLPERLLDRSPHAYTR